MLNPSVLSRLLSLYWENSTTLTMSEFNSLYISAPCVTSAIPYHVNILPSKQRHLLGEFNKLDSGRVQFALLMLYNPVCF